MSAHHDDFWARLRRVRWGRMTVTAVAAAAAVGLTPAVLPGSADLSWDTRERTSPGVSTGYSGATDEHRPAPPSDDPARTR